MDNPGHLQHPRKTATNKIHIIVLGKNWQQPVTSNAVQNIGEEKLIINEFNEEIKENISLSI